MITRWEFSVQLRQSRWAGVYRWPCMLLCSTWTCFAPLLAGADEVAPVSLPQDHDYQVVLRTYLATLTEADFDVTLAPLVFDEAWVASDEALHRLWLVAQYDQRLNPLPSLAGLRIAADNFVLSSIEGESHIMMRAGHRGGLRLRDEPEFSIQPADTVWWALWDYPGNPYYGSRALRNRAFAVVAVDMIMLDNLHESGTHWVDNARRSDFLGGTLLWLSYVYNAVKADLPLAVRTAYETGLAKFVERMTQWGPTGVNDNMDMKANAAMVYVTAALEAGPVVEQARAYVERNLRLVHAAGMIRDAQGLDASYNGIALVNIVWAAVASDWQELLETVRRMSDLKAHLTLPEPDGNEFFGPSHFSTRTGDGAPNDQWSRPYRDVAAAMIADEALYLMFGGRRGRVGRWAAPPRDTMLAQVRRGIEHINSFMTPSEGRFTRWLAGWWPGTTNYARDYYRAGFYERLRTMDETRDPLTLPPFSRPGNTFVRAFPDSTREDVPERDRDAFLVARFADYGVVIYTGPIGRTSYMNFAGGALSAFWTPEGGPIILGRTGHPVHPERSRQGWEDWRLWPTHALSGMTPEGFAFSSARVRRRVSEVSYEVRDDSASVTFGGPIGGQHDGSRTAQNGCIHGEVRYERRFEIAEAGVTIDTRLTADGTDRVSELRESLPLFLRDVRRQGEVPHRVSFLTGSETINATDVYRAKFAGPPRTADLTLKAEDSGDDLQGMGALMDGLIEVPDDFISGVTEVRVERYDGAILIRFESPQRVRLAEEIWTSTYQNQVSVWNLQVDLLNNRGQSVALPTLHLRYHIEPQ